VHLLLCAPTYRHGHPQERRQGNLWVMTSC
jgi:hypothetical protein